MRTTGNNINISLNGVTIGYDDLGTEAAPIIFVHGFPFDKSSWEPQMEFFKHTHRVIAYNVRGFGTSTIGEEALSIRLFADDLVKLMDSLGIRKAIVCGLSMGGYILLNAAYRYSERFEAIVLNDTQYIADSSEMKIKRDETIAHIKTDGLNDFAEGYVDAIFCSESKDTKTELVDKMKNIILSTSPETITATLNALAQRWQMRPSLKKIAVPTLILCGKEDTIAQASQTEFALGNITNTTKQSIENAGNMLNLEQPDEFNRYLSNFISTIENNKMYE